VRLVSNLFWNEQVNMLINPVPGYRRVLLENLPAGCTPEHITRLIYGGRIYHLLFEPGETTAVVQFLLASVAEKYLTATAGGLRWPLDPRRVIRVIRVDKMDTPSIYETALVGGEYTRVVQLINMPANITRKEMLACACEDGRKLEKLRDKKGENSMAFEFHFMNIPDGIRFFAAQKKSKPEGASLVWGKDPCELAKNVH
jgi:hypothetical protein